MLELILLVVGCAMVLSGCNSQNETNENAEQKNKPQPNLKEDDIDDTLNGQTSQGEPVVEHAEVTCTCGEGLEDKLCLMSQNREVQMVNLTSLTQKDIKMTNNGKFKKCSFFNGICPGAEIENDEWAMCDCTSGQGTDKSALNLLESFMMCIKGFGIIYLLNSGQDVGDMEKKRLAHLEEIFKSWWNGEFMMKETIEPIVSILNQNHKMDQYKSYIIDKDKFLRMGFDSSQAEDFRMIDMNRILNKYEINTTERLRHFFAQCYVESGTMDGLTIEQDYGDKTYFEDKSYYPYIGVGHIQLTHEYYYQSLATYIALQKYPEFEENVKHKSPASNGPIEIKAEYDKLKEEAQKAEIDISEIIKIVEPSQDAAQYVAENYEWETAGYFWDSGNANDIVDSLTPGDKNGVDKITRIVNKWTPTYQERRDAYEKNVKDVIK